MKLTDNRVDASLLTEEEKNQLEGFLDLAECNGCLCLKGDGREMPLPEPIFGLMVKLIDDIRRGKAVFIIREDETFTTQAAASYLGMSRQHFVTLIESGMIPFHRVGSHRRIYFKDLQEYAARRDKERRTALGSLFSTLQKEGVYDSD